MDEKLVNQILENMGRMETDELLKIWEANDKEKYSEEAFEAVKRLLEDRRKMLPPQKQAEPKLAAAPQEQPIDNPFDDDSLRVLQQLPRRTGIIPNLLLLLKLVAIPLVALGLIGVFSHILPTMKEGPARDYAIEHIGRYLVWLLIPGGVLAVGGVLWFIHNLFTFNKAPLGDLLAVMLEGLKKGKVDKATMAANSICAQTEAETDSIPVRFARAIALGIRAETARNEKIAAQMAEKSIPLLLRLKETDKDTPLLNFLIATCYRLTKNRDKAVESYKAYLSQHPRDERTKRILAVMGTPNEKQYWS